MSKGRETFNKREKEKKKQKKKEEKAKRKEERKAGPKDSFEDMIVYVDEYGNFTDTPPDPAKKEEIDADLIEVSVPKQEAEDPETEHTGIVTFFNDDKGYGFIRDLKTQESIFTHINSHNEPIKERDKVSFKVEQGPKGLNAVDVNLVKTA